MSRDVESRGVERMGTGDIYEDVSLESVITEAERVSGSAVFGVRARSELH